MKIADRPPMNPQSAPRQPDLYLAVHDTPAGPYSVADVAAMLMRGTIPGHVLLCEDGGSAWIQVAEYEPVMQLLFPPPAPVPEPVPAAPVRPAPLPSAPVLQPAMDRGAAAEAVNGMASLLFPDLGEAARHNGHHPASDAVAPAPAARPQPAAIPPAVAVPVETPQPRQSVTPSPFSQVHPPPAAALSESVKQGAPPVWPPQAVANPAPPKLEPAPRTYPVFEPSPLPAHQARSIPAAPAEPQTPVRAWPPPQAVAPPPAVPEPAVPMNPVPVQAAPASAPVWPAPAVAAAPAEPVLPASVPAQTAPPPSVAAALRAPAWPPPAETLESAPPILPAASPMLFKSAPPAVETKPETSPERQTKARPAKRASKLKEKAKAVREKKPRRRLREIDWRRPGRIGLLALALAVFFLPWLKCGDNGIYYQSGIQTITAKGTVKPDAVSTDGKGLNGLEGIVEEFREMQPGGSIFGAGALLILGLALLSAVANVRPLTIGIMAALALGLLVWQKGHGFPISERAAETMELRSFIPVSLAAKKGPEVTPQMVEEQAKLNRAAARLQYYVVFATPWFYVELGLLGAAALWCLFGGRVVPRAAAFNASEEQLAQD